MHNIEAADLRKVPKNRLRAFGLPIAHEGNGGGPSFPLTPPPRAPSTPWWSLTSPLMVPCRPLYVLLFLILVVNLFSYS